MQAFKGKAAVVTGGAQGIGRALAMSLKRHGVNVFVGDVKDPVKEDKVPFARCDVRKFDQIQGLLKCATDEYGPISLWVNNAGVEFESALGKPFGSHMIKDDKRPLLKDIVDINMMSVIDGTRVAVSHMKEHAEGGTIVNVASMGGFYPMEIAPVYAATKAGVVQYTRSCAQSLGTESMIRILGICPYFVTTPLLTTKPKVIEGLKMLDTKFMEPEHIAEAMEELIASKEIDNGACMQVYMKKDGTIARKIPEWPRGLRV